MASCKVSSIRRWRLRRAAEPLKAREWFFELSEGSGSPEARLDCIGDGIDPPVTEAEMSRNNLDAAPFLRQ